MNRLSLIAGLAAYVMAISAFAGLDDVYWTPAEISTTSAVVAWYDAADTNTLTLAGSVVNQWDDKSTNSNHAVKKSAPTYILSDPMMNNMPCIYHDNTGTYGFLTPSMSVKNFYMVIYYGEGTETEAPNWQSILSNNGGAEHLMLDTAGDWSDQGSEYLEECYRNGTNVTRRDAIPMPATLWRFKNSAALTQTFGIGYGSSSGRNWNGGYSEMIFTDGTEDAATEQKIEGYLAWKWGVEGNLPDDHDYKHTPPGYTGPMINNTNGVAGITATNALLYGELTSTGGAPVTVFCYWNPNSDPGETAAGWMYTNAFGVADATGKYTNDTADTAALTPGTVYYYRYYATNSLGTNWSDAVSFLTYTSPVVTNSTGAVSESATSATLYGELSAGGVAVAWICWSTNDAGTSATSDWGHVVSVGSVSQGVAFSNTVSTLATNTTYFYRCYVTNAYGAAWSDEATPFSGAPGGTWTPAEISTVAWYDAADTSTIGLSGSLVTNWLDRSGNDNNASRASGSAPTYTETDADANNNPTIGADSKAGQVGLLTPDMEYDAVFVVMNHSGGTDSSFVDYENLLSGPGTYGRYRICGDNGNANFRIGGGYCFNDDSYKNGSTTSTALSVLPMSNTLFRFEASEARTQPTALGYSQSNSGRTWNGGFCEWIFTLGASAGDKEKIEGYLAHKWGLAGDLRSDHPYKDSAPGGGSSAIVNLAPTNITSSVASLNASLDATGTNYAVYVYYGNTDGGTNASSWAATNSVDSYTDVSTNVSYTASLAAGQTWYYTFMASNTDEMVWAEPSWSFNTLPLTVFESTVFRFR